LYESAVGCPSGQSLSVEREQAAPRLLGLWLVVDLRVRRTPTMRGPFVDFDFRRQVRLGERFLEDVLLVGRTLIVICRNRDQKLRLGLCGL